MPSRKNQKEVKRFFARLALAQLTTRESSFLGEFYGKATSEGQSPVISEPLAGMDDDNPQRNVVTTRTHMRGLAVQHRAHGAFYNLKREMVDVGA